MVNTTDHLLLSQLTSGYNELSGSEYTHTCFITMCSTLVGFVKMIGDSGIKHMVISDLSHASGVFAVNCQTDSTGIYGVQSLFTLPRY